MAGILGSAGMVKCSDVTLPAWWLKVIRLLYMETQDSISLCNKNVT